MNVTVPFIADIPAAETEAWLHALSSELPDANIVPFKALSDTSRHHVALVANPKPEDVRALPDLEWVQSLWAGVEKLIQEPALAKLGIARLVDPQLAKSMAEAVLSWTLYLHRDMPKYRALQAQKQWQALPYVMPQDRKIGLLGLGELGQAAAASLSQNNFNVFGWSRSEKQIEGVQGFHGASGLSQMISKCDILVCLLPLTEETRGLINGRLIEKMQRGASIINFGRGPIINNDDLLSALDSGKLGHAVLDVFDIEPLEASSLNWEHPHVTVLPHISAPTTVATAAKVAAKNLRTYFETGAKPQLVDRERGY